METRQAPVSHVAVMVLFALSCVGLLLYLWLSFGGEVPFNPRGYRFEVAFRDAQQVATQADVRIAGVSVGKVISKTLDPNGNRTLAVIQLNNKYAPIHQDATAILRTKTLLGETYVQLTPGSRFAPALADNGILKRGQVQPAVQLDTIFNAFDANTRKAFQTWQQELASAVRGNDINLNNVFGNLPMFAADATDILAVLDVEHGAVVNLVRNGGTVFGALSQNQAALRDLITSSDTVFRTTARNQAALADVIHVFPEFLDQSRFTMDKLRTFSFNEDQACCVANSLGRQTKPLLKELVDVAHNLTPTLQAVRALSPPLKHLFVNLNPLITVSQKGLPATAEFLKGLGCNPSEPTIKCAPNPAKQTLLPELGTFLEQLNPIVNWLGLHQQLISDFIGQGSTPMAAITTALGGNGMSCNGRPCGHYLRQFGVSGNETLGIYQNRDPNNRGNTYPDPLFGVNPNVRIQDDPAAWDCNNSGVHGPQGDQPTGSPACWLAPPLARFLHQKQKFPHILQAKYPDK
jgi:phospholipid/cholesterol/gamma-HCH transport system substrate-binding protein